LLNNARTNDEDEREKLGYLIKTKKWNAYCIRHSAITADSDYLPEYALKKKVRWSMNSKQGSRYIKRRMGNVETKDTYLQWYYFAARTRKEAINIELSTMWSSECNRKQILFQVLLSIGSFCLSRN
jgi:hypothetical protein